jgi:alkylation response protein AidB-like acyl-CoA dehydrogenase
MSSPTRKSDALFSDALIPGEALSIRQEVRQFADDVVRPVAHRLNTTPESRENFPHALFEAMARAGLYAIPFASDVGGRGLEFPTLATMLVMEELAYYSPSLASALYDGQAILVGQTLDRAGGSLRERYLPRLVRGEFVGSFATSEPEASTDLSAANMRTQATQVEGGWRIDGLKRWITNSVAADHIAVLCRSGERQTFLFADMHAPGITVGDPDRKMGNYVQLTADVRFDQVFVPADHVIGEVGAGLRAALGALMLGRIGIGAIGVAMAQAAFDYATDYISRRKVFGKPIGAFQHWQFRFADHAIAIENARSLYQKAALLNDRSRQAETESAMAKIAGSELAVDVARDAIQACGAYGFVQTLGSSGEHFPLESIYRDAKIGEIYEGANEVQRWVIARSIFGRAITG